MLYVFLTAVLATPYPKTVTPDAENGLPDTKTVTPDAENGTPDAENGTPLPKNGHPHTVSVTPPPEKRVTPSRKTGTEIIVRNKSEK